MQKIKLDVTPVFDFLQNCKERIVVLRGGTRSSKSYSLAQHIIFNKLMAGNDRVIIVARKTLPALRKTAMKLVLDLLDAYKIPYKFNKTDLELRYKNNLLYFMSLDDPGKIASIDFNDCWLEEAVDFTAEDFRMFNIRASRKGDHNQIYLSFNPVSALHWIKTELLDKRKTGIAEHVSTYKDNIEHLPAEIVKEIEDLIDQDINFYNIYALGLWGVLEDVIYSNYSIFDKLPEKIDEISYGVDWGFNSPSAIVEINWIDGKFIARELLYKAGLTQQELVSQAVRLIPKERYNCEMYIDASEPALIQAFYDVGFNAHPAKKDVLAGISFVKTHMLGITKDSVNGIKELQSYSWKKDKDGNLVDPAAPVKFNDHFCDAKRYGSYSTYKSYPEAKALEFTMR